jgi:superoxide reductase
MKQLDIYQCGVCGNTVEIIKAGGGELVCCNQPMNALEEKTADAATEKHVPVIEKTATGYKVTVGSVPHPMADDHYIEWIELVAGDQAIRQFLQPGAEPSVTFDGIQADSVSAREHCNKHGLWKS